VYAQADGGAKFVRDFAAAWVKVMELGRFERP
jgi:catalase-peroxidase